MVLMSIHNLTERRRQTHDAEAFKREKYFVTQYDYIHVQHQLFLN